MNQKTKQLIDEMDGKRIDILRMEIDSDSSNNRLELRLVFCLNETKHSMKFQYITMLNVKNVSGSFVIEGFELLDQKERGWESCNRYYVHDFESGVLSFYCEDVILESN